jgi:hypothetical protein
MRLCAIHHAPSSENYCWDTAKKQATLTSFYEVNIMTDWYEPGTPLPQSFDGKPLSAAAFCSECQRVLPLRRFQRYLSGGEALNLGYLPGAKVLVDTTHCADCRPKRTPEKHLSNTQVRSRVATGEMNELKGRLILQDRALKASDAMRRGQATARHNARKRSWDVHVDAVMAEITPVRHQLKYAKARPAKERQPTVIAFLDAYLDVLRSVESLLKLNRRKASNYAEFDNWHKHVTFYQRNILKACWGDIPVQVRVRMRQPDLLQRQLEASTSDRKGVLKLPTGPEATAKPAPPMQRTVVTFDDEINGVGMP